MEDLDVPRCVPRAADDILRTLETFGLHWDEEIIHQSQRTGAYEEALRRLQAIDVVYPCACTRKEISDSALHGIEGPVYPGTCRNGVPPTRAGRAWRVRTNKLSTVRPESVEGSKDHLDKLRANGVIEFDDTLQGHLTQHLESEIGDFVVKRADGLFAYQLAVVVDDAFQNITHIVRGADLLHSTPRQIYLQRLLGFPTPAYMHLPVAVNTQGEKLSKQTLAPAIATGNVIATLIAVLEFLRQQPPAELQLGNVEEVLRWAVANWHPERLKGCRQRAITQSSYSAEPRATPLTKVG